jgi:hypothetical protein
MMDLVLLVVLSTEISFAYIWEEMLPAFATITLEESITTLITGVAETLNLNRVSG